MRSLALRWWPLALGVAVTVALSSCSGTDSPPAANGESPGTPSGSAAPPAVTSTPGGQATSFPVPADATAAPLPDLGTATGQGVTLTINSLQRSGPQSALLSATVTNPTGTDFDDFTEPGYGTLLDPTTKKPLGGAYDFSAVTLAVKGDQTVYQVMRDEQQRCACSAGLFLMPKGQPFSVWAYLTLPENADTVTITVKGLAPFANVKVTP